ncbi:MAG: hypothetical protein PF689_05630 [Deltaproteobacteria bacterium]|jgi:type IV secretory pathway VirB10-like protein|nr:hypothetical protein [Deltaproteobacteria bacterium]
MKILIITAIATLLSFNLSACSKPEKKENTTPTEENNIETPPPRGKGQLSLPPKTPKVKGPQRNYKSKKHSRYRKNRYRK